MAGEAGRQARIEALLAELVATMRGEPAAAAAAPAGPEILNAIPIPVNPGGGEERAIAMTFSK